MVAENCTSRRTRTSETNSVVVGSLCESGDKVGVVRIRRKGALKGVDVEGETYSSEVKNNSKQDQTGQSDDLDGRHPKLSEGQGKRKTVSE